ncbi:DUF2442 domain-containing protein [Rhizobium sp. G21]|uniref:DUF2442 domain-containing protein n=1 Tax=Rhizobium sp. G21 TaxID=2758439 RepID=UPI001602B02D|nr:DUF2442 domain-containing protein [Rhizobium sp. G21]MBB1248510.1 DUF2442 domain-containing protein [Rhizobium sp. G21]
MSDDRIRIGAPLPRIIKANPVEGREVEITFDGGRPKRVDLRPVLESRKFFIPLRKDDEAFRRFKVSDYGDALEWPDGVELGALWLERLPDISFNNADFRDAMQRLGLSLDGMAAALGLSRRQIAHYRDDKPIPRHVALATRYLVDRAGADAAE